MKIWVKGALIGLIICILLIIISYLSGILIECNLPTNEFGEALDGAVCLNTIQSIILIILTIISLPFMALGANPHLTSVGPIGVSLFYIGSLINSIILGSLIGLIINKIKRKK